MADKIVPRVKPYHATGVVGLPNRYIPVCMFPVQAARFTIRHANYSESTLQVNDAPVIRTRTGLSGKV